MLAMPREINVQRALDPNFPSLQDKGILAAICDWVEQNTAKIQHAHALDVGWEIWAQVDLAVHINQRLGGQYATRAAAVYQADAFADVVVWNGANQTGNPVHVIELKCRRPNHSAADFRAELNDDRFKLTQNAVAVAYTHARKWGIGINIGTALTGLGGDWKVQVVPMTPLTVYYRCFV
jgi:hypothetical protein